MWIQLQDLYFGVYILVRVIYYIIYSLHVGENDVINKLYESNKEEVNHEGTY